MKRGLETYLADQEMPPTLQPVYIDNNNFEDNQRHNLLVDPSLIGELHFKRCWKSSIPGLVNLLQESVNISALHLTDSSFIVDQLDFLHNANWNAQLTQCDFSNLSKIKDAFIVQLS